MIRAIDRDWRFYAPRRRGDAEKISIRVHSCPLVAVFAFSSLRLCVSAVKNPLSIITVALLWLTGCGYQQMGVDNANNTPGYQWKSLYRQDVQTVAVPVFVNRTYRRGLEMELTKLVIEQLEEHAPYKVVPKERADTILEGEITDAEITTLSTNGATGLPQEQAYTIVVNFTWKNLRTGEILVQRKNFDQKANFVPTLGESSSVASTNALQQLGLAIVQELQAEW